MTVRYDSDSIYKNTKIIDNKYLDVQSPAITDHSNYLLVDKVISPKYENRPDLLANELYGNPKIWWIFAEFNQDILKDPIIDFKSGLTIKVPTDF